MVFGGSSCGERACWLVDAAAGRAGDPGPVAPATALWAVGEDGSGAWSGHGGRV